MSADRSGQKAISHQAPVSACLLSHPVTFCGWSKLQPSRSNKARTPEARLWACEAYHHSVCDCLATLWTCCLASSLFCCLHRLSFGSKGGFKIIRKRSYSVCLLCSSQCHTKMPGGCRCDRSLHGCKTCHWDLGASMSIPR